MKIRNGFVSNSSSSSFVVAFPVKPKDEKELLEIMFNNKEEYMNEWGDRYKTEEVVEHINSLIGNPIATEEEMIESVRNGWFESYKDLPGYVDDFEETKNLSYQNTEEKKKIDKIFEEADKENSKRAKEIIKRFISENSGAFFTVFHFADDDGKFEGQLEHSNIFQNLSHIRTSYH